MMKPTNMRLWTFLTFITIAATVWSFVGTTKAGTICDVNADCGCTPAQEALNCSPASGARGNCSGFVCFCNPGFGGLTCGTATPTATATGTATGTATATRTPGLVPQGGSCMNASQCQPSLFCADGVCCDTACTGPDQRCDLPGREGVCLTAAPAPAPTVSPTGLLFGAVLLSVIGLIALLRRRRAQ